MGSSTAWLLNFEADLEFACAGAYTPPSALALQLDALREQHAARLLAADDVLIVPGLHLDGAQWQAVAWCPTPSALARIEAAGLRAPAAPALSILAEANSRCFCATLGENLPGALFSTCREEILEHLAQSSPADGWLLKRNYGTSGKGQLRVKASGLDGQLQPWLEAALKQGGVRVEPRLNIVQEFAMHGWLGQDARLELGAPCLQACSPHGTWMETRRSAPSDWLAGEVEALHAALQASGEALSRLGYHGPFGVDAYRWLDESGRVQLQVRSEINARFTLGWGVGFPAQRPRPWQQEDRGPSD